VRGTPSWVCVTKTAWVTPPVIARARTCVQQDGWQRWPCALCGVITPLNVSFHARIGMLCTARDVATFGASSFTTWPNSRRELLVTHVCGHRVVLCVSHARPCRTDPRGVRVEDPLATLIALLCTAIHTRCRRLSSPLLHSGQLLSFLQHMGASFVDLERFHCLPTPSPCSHLMI